MTDNESVRIIEFTEDDAQEIADLFVLVWPQASEYPPVWRRKRCLTAEQIVQEMRAGYHYFGVRLQGRIAGLYKASITADGLLGEHQTVHPGFRHRGLVRAMYDQFINYAQAIGAAANSCNILVQQKSMCHLVESFGFLPLGRPYEQAPNMLVQLYCRTTGLRKQRKPKTSGRNGTAKRSS
jgi:hypothetical protein